MSRQFKSQSAISPETSSATRRETKENEQVTALYELGLLGSGKGSRAIARRRLGNADEENPGRGNRHTAKTSTHPDQFPFFTSPT